MATYSDRQREDIRAANPIAIAAARDFGLRVRGAYMQCPIHNGQDLNAHILPDGHRAYCHSHCAASFDLFGMAMAQLGCAFPAAVEYMARRTPGIGDPDGFDQDAMASTRLRPAPKAAPPEARFTPIPPDEQAVMDVCVDVWHDTLLRHEDALGYLRRRGIDDTVIRALKLGYSDGSLAQVLAEDPATRTAALACKVLNVRDGKAPGVPATPRETMNGRIIVPEWRTIAGVPRPVFAIGRLLRISGPNALKYLCTRGPRPLMGLEDAEAAVQGDDDEIVYLVESQFDRLVLLSWGVTVVCNGQARPGPLVIAETRRLAGATRMVAVPNMDQVGLDGMRAFLDSLGLPAAQRPLTVHLPEGLNDIGELGEREAMTDDERAALPLYPGESGIALFLRYSGAA